MVKTSVKYEINYIKLPPNAELLCLTGNLVYFKGRFSRFAYTMKRNVDFSCSEETRHYMVKVQEPFNFDFVLLVAEKDVSHHD